MSARGVTAPDVGQAVEIQRPRSTRDSQYEPAVVVEHLHDPAIGLVLEVQFEDTKRMQRVWPTPAIRRPAA